MANPQKKWRLNGKTIELNGGFFSKPSVIEDFNQRKLNATLRQVQWLNTCSIYSMGRCWDLAKLGIEIPEKPRIVLSLSLPLWNMTGT